ncbi:hypothetical protein ACOSQ2_029347 [Xanthoceras sorbifolium]
MVETPVFSVYTFDTFAAIRIASRDMPEEVVVLLSSRKLCPVRDFFEEWLLMENLTDKMIGISSSAYQLKPQLVDAVRNIVGDLEY